MKRLLLVPLIQTLVCVAAQAGTMSVPQLINYQGKLTDPSGEPVEAGYYDLEFRIYDAATAGTITWGPQTITDVPVVHGRFSVLLGPRDDITAGEDALVGALGSGPSYVEVTIPGGPALTPRQQLLSTPFALVAKNSVPIGCVLPWIPPVQQQDLATLTWSAAEALLPTGYKICNGGRVQDDLDTDYDERKIPDLVDRFVMGADVQAGNIPVGPDNDDDGEPDMLLGQSQGTDTHGHDFTAYTGFESNPVVIDIWTGGGNVSEEVHNHRCTASADAIDQQRHVPPYVSVLFIIRVD